MAAAYRYDPFGKLLARTGALDQPFQFSTKRIDALTGLVYYGYRFYSTEPDRWTTRDPLGEAGGVNLYVFVGNDPVNWVDPWGWRVRYPGIENAAKGIADAHGKLHGYESCLAKQLRRLKKCRDEEQQITLKLMNSAMLLMILVKFSAMFMRSI